MAAALSILLPLGFGPLSPVAMTIGAVVVTLVATATRIALGSTIWAAIPSWSRSWANALCIVGVFDWVDSRVRIRWMRFFIAFLPIMWLLTFLWIDSPWVMIMVGGIAGGIFLAAVAVSALYLRGHLESALRGGRFIHVALIPSAGAIIALGIYSAVITVIG